MKTGAIENRRWILIAVLALAILLTIGLSLALYTESRRQLSEQQMTQVRIETAFLASDLPRIPSAINEESIRSLLQHHSIQAVAALYWVDGKLIARGSSIESAIESQRFSAGMISFDSSGLEEATTQRPIRASSVRLRSDNGFVIARVRVPDLGLLVVARPAFSASTAITFYVLSYQVVALIFGLGVILLTARWLIRPYRRLVKAAHDSPVHAASARSESEFVVETFQALIEQLREKEKELERLHATERTRAERSERFSERLIANMPSGLVSVDSRGIVTSINTRATEIFGIGQYDTGPLTPERVFGAQQAQYQTLFRSAPRMVALVSNCLAGGTSFRREIVDLTCPDGRIRHLGLSVSPITDMESKLEGALCLLTDITEVIELRERMKLQENLANLGEMAAGIAHEFKNSLATIQGYVQLMEAQSVSGNQPVSTQAALNEVRLLAQLVTDFLNFARPQSLALSTIDLRALIADCIDEVSPLLSAAEIEIAFEGEEVEMPGDESLLRRVFGNLLRNAIEAIDPLSEKKTVRVSLYCDSAGDRRHAHIRISDTGRGISVQDLQRIFIPFFTTKSRGYGIGLAIVQKIVVAHGGNVAVEKSDTTGTTFHCRLPLELEQPGLESFHSEDI
jgi:PAS domain S-box-containing protein